MTSTVDLRWKCYRNNKYSWRECLEALDIPGSVGETELEKNFIEVFNKIDAPFDPCYTEDC